MDPLVVFDCDRILPNRFALALAAAARSRALNHGAEPRSARPSANTSELALNEIAQGCFTPVELEPFLGWPEATLPPPLPALELRASDPQTNACAPAPQTREAVIDDNPNRRTNDAKVSVLQ